MPQWNTVGNRFSAKLEEVEKWLLNSARNANKPTPVASAITTKKVNAPRRLRSMRLLNHPTRHQETRKVTPENDGIRRNGQTGVTSFVATTTFRCPLLISRAQIVSTPSSFTFEPRDLDLISHGESGLRCLEEGSPVFLSRSRRFPCSIQRVRTRHASKCCPWNFTDKERTDSP